MGPPCGSYIWMNRATSCRSRENPYGDQSREYVERASMTLSSIFLFNHSESANFQNYICNCKWRCNFKSLWLRNPMKSDRSSWILLSWAIFRICVRALLLLILATARGAYVVLEQPASSVHEVHAGLCGHSQTDPKTLGTLERAILVRYWDFSYSSLLHLHFQHTLSYPTFLPRAPLWVGWHLGVHLRLSQAGSGELRCWLRSRLMGALHCIFLCQISTTWTLPKQLEAKVLVAQIVCEA